MFDILDDDDLDIDDADLHAPEIDDYVEDPATHAQTVAWRDDIAQRMYSFEGNALFILSVQSLYYIKA